jgi:hypothetical protein
MRWLSPRRFRHTKARYGLSVVAFFAVASQLGSVAHLAFVRHVECADHGEMVEVSASPAVDHEDKAAAFHPDSAPTHEHDHCGIATLRRERTQTTSAPAAAAPQPRSDLGRTLVRAIAPPPSIAILDLAPKTSPPTV